MSADAAASPALPPCYLISFNVSKRHNIGTISRCATAFGVKQIHIVGSRKFNTFGAHGADAHVELVYHSDLESCVRTLREELGCRVLGIEIDDRATSVLSAPFSGPTAFMLGNEGQGLNDRQMALCDAFVYIPQYGPGTASLNVAVATSIVLHRFAEWAGYPERSRHGAKFDVDPHKAGRDRVRIGFERTKAPGSDGSDADGVGDAVGFDDL